MVNLIYPAVLGSVLYIALDYLNRVFVPAWVAPKKLVAVPLDEISAAKAALLLLTVVFYCCDYLYLRWTVRFKVLFFVYDVLFLIGLYLTTGYVHVEAGDMERPEVATIACLFLIFMLFYLLWDLLEHRELVTEWNQLTTHPTFKPAVSVDSKVSTKHRRLRAELRLYADVIKWEIFSVVLLVVAWASARYWPHRWETTWLLIAMLSIVSALFVILISRKGRIHYKYA